MGGLLETATYTDYTYTSPFTYYQTTGGSVPRAYKRNGVVTICGAFKNTELVEKASEIPMGKVPTGFEPNEMVRALSQGSGMNRYLFIVHPNGNIYMERYGTTTEIDVPANSWLTFYVTYLAKTV